MRTSNATDHVEPISLARPGGGHSIAAHPRLYPTPRRFPAPDGCDPRCWGGVARAVTARAVHTRPGARCGLGERLSYEYSMTTLSCCHVLRHVGGGRSWGGSCRGQDPHDGRSVQVASARARYGCGGRPAPGPMTSTVAVRCVWGRPKNDKVVATDPTELVIGRKLRPIAPGPSSDG